MQFTGLLKENDEQRAARKAALVDLPPCGGPEVEEVLHKEFPQYFKPKMQYYTNSCAGHGGAHALIQAIYAQTGSLMDLSAWFVYLMGQKEGGGFGSDGGAYLGGVQSALMKYGSCMDDLCPNLGRYYTGVKQQAYDDAKNHLVTKAVDLEAGGYDRLRFMLGQQLGSGVFAVGWPIRFDSDGDVSVYRPGSAGHAMCWHSLSAKLDRRGRPWVWCVNSHDVHTRYRMSPDAVQSVIDDDEWGAFGVLSTNVPVPRVDWRKREMIG